MKASTIIALISILVVCHFCKKDFKILGRHSWQCKSKPMNLTSNSNHGESITIAEKVPCNNDFIHCMCGKKCKGVRGLKRHQRSCRTIKSFSADIINPPGTKGFGTHTKHQGGGGRKGPPSISRTRNATNLKPLEGLGVSFKVSKNFKLV